MLSPWIKDHEYDAYITPNERTIDGALLKGDFDSAAEYANTVIDRYRSNPPETLPNELFHVMVKQASMPLYRWAYANVRDAEYVIDHSEIEGVADVEENVVDLLQKIRRISRETEHDWIAEKQYIGYRSELTILALFCHELNHNPGALRAALPTRKEIDMGSTTEGDVETGIDFAVFNITTCQITPLQVKTTNEPFNYRGDILIVSAMEIAGGSNYELQRLQTALVAENEGTATREQRTHINRATSDLIEIIAATERSRRENSDDASLHSLPSTKYRQVLT